MAVKQRVVVLDTEVLSIDGAVSLVRRLVEKGDGAYLCLANVHQCMEAYDDPEFRRVVNSADGVLADGRPIYWAQRLFGHSGAGQVRGEDLMLAICEQAAAQQWRVGFYGGADEALLQVIDTRLRTRFSGLQQVYSHSPPFRPLSAAEDAAVLQAITEAEVDILFVGIGCPKQERWMYLHRDRLDCVMLGVGAAFDFITEAKPGAPGWVQRLGLEWLFRLLCEPRRLFWRYARTNPRFVVCLARQWLQMKWGALTQRNRRPAD